MSAPSSRPSLHLTQKRARSYAAQVASASFAGVLDWDLLIRTTIYLYLWKVMVEVVLTPVTYRVIAHIKREHNSEANHLANQAVQLCKPSSSKL